MCRYDSVRRGGIIVIALRESPLYPPSSVRESTRNRIALCSCGGNALSGWHVMRHVCPNIFACCLVILAGCVQKSGPSARQFSRLPPPTFSFVQSSVPSTVVGGKTYVLRFSARAADPLKVREMRIQLATDGTNFSDIAVLAPGTVQYEWSVPAIDVESARIKFVAEDTLLYQTETLTNSFRIRTKSPHFTQDYSPASVFNRLDSVNYGGICETDVPVTIALLGQPTPTQLRQFNCAGGAWSFVAQASEDGQREYEFQQCDPIDNCSIARAVWTRDTVVPHLTQTSAPSSVVNNLNAVTYGGECESGLPVLVEETVGGGAAQPIASPSCSGTWTYQASATSDATRTYRFSQTDLAENNSAVTAVWVRDTVPPPLTQTLSGSSVFNAAPNQNYGGNCEAGVPVTVFLVDAGGSPISSNDVACASGNWTTIVSQPSDGTYRYRFSQTDIAGNTATLNAVKFRDSIAPVITPGSVVINEGAASTSINYVRVSLQASDTASNVTHFCLKYATGATPSPTTDCWIAVDNPDQPNLTPALTLTLSQYNFRIGFTPNAYTIFSWVRDEAGNVSQPESASIQYQPGVPPVITNVIATSTANPSTPLSVQDVTAAPGANIYIRWNAVGANGLGSNPVTLYYTTNNRDYNLIASSLINGDNGGCAPTLPLHTGCYVWSQTVGSSYFSVRVAVTDVNGMITFSSSNYVNSHPLEVIAGNTDSLTGSSATAALFYNAAFLDPDINSFVVTNDGNVYFRDVQRGLIRIQPRDGIQQVLIPRTGVMVGDNGDPVSSAQLQVPLKIALDYNNGLLIFDWDRIRRIDLATMTIRTVVGGGAQTTDGCGPLDVLITPPGGISIWTVQMPLIPLPNGDLLFQSDTYFAQKARFRYYSASTGLVASISPHGTGTRQDPNKDIDDCTSMYLGSPIPCYMVNLLIEYNANSNITSGQIRLQHPVAGGRYTQEASISMDFAGDLGNSQAPHPQAIGSAMVYGFTGRNGIIYEVDRFYGRIWKYNSSTDQSWTLLVGTGAQGDCEDHTPALSCAIRPADAFVDGAGVLYFSDAGRIRTIDGSGEIITLYGQGLHFGDGALALSARFGTIYNIDQSNNGKIVVADREEHLLREFTVGGTIDRIAGQAGAYGPPDYTNPLELARDQRINMMASGTSFDFFKLDPATGDVFLNIGLQKLGRLNRATGHWELVSTDPNYANYPMDVIGFDGTNVLAGNEIWDPSLGQLVKGKLRLFPINGDAPTLVVGSDGPGVGSGNFCSDGTPNNNCALPWVYNSLISSATYDLEGKRWFFLGRPSSAIRWVTTDTTVDPTLTVHTLTPLTMQSAISFAYRRVGGVEEVYYCGNDGRLYRRTLSTPPSEQQLPWAVPSMTCSGASLLLDRTGNRLIFPYVQNKLTGVARYSLP